MQKERRIEHLEQENGKSTERKGSTATSKRKRGAQVGGKGQGRTNREQLPEVIEHTERLHQNFTDECAPYFFLTR